MTKVLIVEDHASMRESLAVALTAAGDFSVVGEVPNADYALDFCRHLHPDLVLMDVCTEGGASGLKAVEDIRKSDEEIKIIRTKKFDMKPMYPEDACVEMELLGHDFYVFINAETEDVNVVYKRKGNTYGLIEPEY